MKNENKPFPECASGCELLEYFGVCECEAFCPNKFDPNGDPLTKEEIQNEKSE